MSIQEAMIVIAKNVMSRERDDVEKTVRVNAQILLEEPNMDNNRMRQFINDTLPFPWTHMIGIPEAVALNTLIQSNGVEYTFKNHMCRVWQEVLNDDDPEEWKVALDQLDKMLKLV